MITFLKTFQENHRLATSSLFTTTEVLSAYLHITWKMLIKNIFSVKHLTNVNSGNVETSVSNWLTRPYRLTCESQHARLSLNKRTYLPRPEINYSLTRWVCVALYVMCLHTSSRGIGIESLIRCNIHITLDEDERSLLKQTISDMTDKN